MPQGVASQRDGARAAAQQFLEALLSATKTPGISAAVAAGNRLVFSSGVGVIDVENRVPATGSSVYNFGSVSKAITAVAVLQLLDNNQLTLDDDVRSYVPEFPDKGFPITLRHLLTHTSGIRHYHPTDFPGTPDNENIAPVDSYLDGLEFFAQDPLLFAPGRYRFYTSYGVNLLQGVVERVSGMSFDQYLRDRVWRPAGMNATGFDDPEVIVAHRARSYRWEDGQLKNAYYSDIRYKYASGGMIGSVEDLVRFGAALNHAVLLRPETRRLMYAPQGEGILDFREGQPPQPQRRGQGLLWELRQDAAGRRVAFHCGSVKGFNACIVNFYDENLVAAIATNSWECCGWAKADSLAGFFRAK
jgi:CubicO group peptidase (beta-lactamase class C family)